MTELLNMPGSGLVVLIILSLIVYWVIRMTQSRGEEETVAAAQATPAAPVPAIDEDSYAVLLAAVSEEELRDCNLGYRSRYVKKTAQMILDGQVSLESVRKLDYPQAREELQKLYGVGTKVADCICLFALHQMEAFPVDTHIRQALEKHYPQGFPFERYKGCSGVMQQYIFYRELLQ